MKKNLVFYDIASIINSGAFQVKEKATESNPLLVGEQVTLR